MELPRLHTYADSTPKIRLDLPKDFVRLGRCIALNRLVPERETGPLRALRVPLVVRGASFFGRRA